MMSFIQYTQQKPLKPFKHLIYTLMGKDCKQPTVQKVVSFKHKQLKCRKYESAALKGYIQAAGSNSMDWGAGHL